MPYLTASGELKTKPTQHSVRELRSIGIQPDIIGLRSDYPVDDDIRAKVALFCDVEHRAVVPLLTVDSIYKVPLMLEEAGVGDLVVKKLRLKKRTKAPDLKDWRDVVDRINHDRPTVQIALVGKYVELHDAYMSVRESLIHAGLWHRSRCRDRLGAQRGSGGRR